VKRRKTYKIYSLVKERERKKENLTDTFLDMAIVSSGSNNIGIFLRYDYGSFTNQVTYLTDSSSLSVVVGDFNNDLVLDILLLPSMTPINYFESFILF